MPLTEFVERDPLRQAVDLLISGKVRPEEVVGLVVPKDPLAEYRQIEGLVVVGPAELDKLFRTIANPLGLKEGWVPENIPVGDDPERMDAWLRSCIWRDHKDWQTRTALVLTPRAIGGVPTSLIG